ncbi:MAG: alginate lyase family protein [Planctomycetota bacterium]|nr:alginate lyase family protein [Planctomycetota bacterium]
MKHQPTEPPRPSAEAFVIPDRESFLRALNLDLPALADVKEALEQAKIQEAGRAYVQHFRTCDLSSPLLTEWDSLERDPSHENAIAEDCLRGRLYDGYNYYDIPEEGIDWYDCPLFCLPRFPIFPSLTASWHHKQDERYLRFVIDHASEYMNAYPIEYFEGKHSSQGYRNHYLVGPPTWWCLCPNRLEAWSSALALLRTSPLVTDEEILLSLHRMLQEIRYFITQMPFWVGRRHNVAAFTIRVFGILSRVFQDFTESARWRQLDAEWLAEYIDEGFYPDGLFKELTLGYTSSVTAQTSRIAAVLFDESPIQQRREQLAAMVAAMVGLTKPTGPVPSFGDGPGRTLGVVWCPQLVARLEEPWLEEISDAIQEIMPFVPSGNPSRDIRPEEWPDFSKSSPPFTEWPPAGEAAWGGYYAMRSDWSADARYLMVDGGPWGTTHRHMDKLSFELAAYGADFITDPGNTQYANNEPDARISMLNAGFMHNTITVDGVDEFVRDVSEFATDKPLSNRWEVGKNHVVFSGTFDFRPHKDVQWERRILFVDRDYWLLQDVLTGEADEIEVEQNFQFERNIELLLRGEQAIAKAPNQARLVVVPLDEILAAAVVTGEEMDRCTWSTQSSTAQKPRPFGHGRGWISRVTKNIQPAPALVRSGRVTLPCTLTLALVPVSPAEEEADLSSVSQQALTEFFK